ncbi:cycloartenol synthase [Quercus suber]|uniref:Cycloartenol synthase n=1 Tax=Quercus suber TaxID=58331 RepID=A0AAW0K5T9_QUESU
MSYLYGKRFVGPITSTIQSLRKELYTVPYHEIDWNEARNLCVKIGKNYTFFFSFKLSTFNFYPSIL